MRLRCGCVYFFNLLKTSTVPHDMSFLQNRVGRLPQLSFVWKPIIRTKNNSWKHQIRNCYSSGMSSYINTFVLYINDTGTNVSIFETTLDLAWEESSYTHAQSNTSKEHFTVVYCKSFCNHLCVCFFHVINTNVKQTQQKETSMFMD